jgi:hypothetical protein
MHPVQTTRRTASILSGSPGRRPWFSQIAGEQGAADVSISVAPWPSDHRAVVSEFSVVSSAMPRFANTGQRVYTQGEEVVVGHHGTLEAEGLQASGDLLRITRLVPGQAAAEVPACGCRATPS